MFIPNEQQREQIEVILCKDISTLRMPVFNKGLVKKVLNHNSRNYVQVSFLNTQEHP